ncbi:hypothetical protein VNO77_17119 [Canavalia gladiata]|uniref:Uncharacterized protein n=1 Tax=Canavalia gladiata TaxID=3824 RepID=A0AAN9QIF4_CANGL
MYRIIVGLTRSISQSCANCLVEFVRWGPIKRHAIPTCSSTICKSMVCVLPHIMIIIFEGTWKSGNEWGKVRSNWVVKQVAISTPNFLAVGTLKELGTPHTTRPLLPQLLINQQTIHATASKSLSLLFSVSIYT